MLQGKYVSRNLFKRAKLRWLVEVAREADLVPNLRVSFNNPGILGARQHLTADECIDPAILVKRNLLIVTQVWVRFVFNDLAVRRR